MLSSRPLHLSIGDDSADPDEADPADVPVALGHSKSTDVAASTRPKSIGVAASARPKSIGVAASTRPKTIGVLADYMNASGSAYEAQIRDAIDARCRDLGHNLLVIYGRALEDPAPVSVPHNAIFQHIGSDVVDGLLLISSCLAALSGVAGIRRLTCRYPSLPLCSIGLEVPDVPSVVSDNAPGMAAVVEHLIVEHGCRKIAFIAGSRDNPEAQIRFEVYREILARHGLRYNPDLVGDGAFAKEHAYKAVESMLAQGIFPDAVVAANDAMAAGAMQALRESGRRIPRDVLVTGYDDMPFARLGNPPLTTIRQPLEAMATLAVDTLLEQIAGHSVPMCTKLPTEMVVRRSCGCHSYGQLSATPSTRNPRGPALDYVLRHAARLRQLLANCLTTGPRDPAPDAARLLDGLLRELQGNPESFLRVVEDLIEEAAGDDDRGRALQLALISLRQELLDVSTLELESIWYEAATVVALANGTGRALDRLTTDERAFLLMGSAEQTSMALDLAALEQVLVKTLPTLGIRTAFLSTHSAADDGELVPLVALVQGEALTRELTRFPSRQLLPPQALNASPRRTFLVYPMAYDGQALGVAAFEYEDRAAAYSTVLAQVSIAVRNIALHEQMLQKTMLHERSVQERLATTKRLEALGVLAGGVAHDLNNALSPMLALSDVVLSELTQLTLPGGSSADLVADVETIRAASLQAAQTIKDLLTLGRQGRLAQLALSLNEVVRQCESSSVRSLREAHPGLAITLELALDPLMVLGSEAQLARAIANLIHNATDAIAGSGQLQIRTARVTLTEPHFGYERVEPGDYAAVCVADDGAGISSAELGHIFEPFFSKKRKVERSGTGLGLAIVHGVVKEHRGYVDVTSVVGKGTTFTLYIPLTNEPKRISIPLPPILAGNARILLIDDDPLLLRTCSRVLGRLGYEVVTSDSGQRSLEQFQRAAPAKTSPFDVVVMDVVLNESLDGLELLERIYALFPQQKAIITSGHTASCRIEQAVQRGLVWLAKPYTADTLARTIQLALEG